MYALNKIVWFFLNPVVIPIVGAAVGAVLLWKGRFRRLGGGLLVLSLALLWFESTAMCVCLVGLPLERPYLAYEKVESLPQADAIVVLGGGMTKNDELAYPDMFDAADRVWHAARLWKAGKAPRIVLSGRSELAASVPLLQDFGVPRDAILVDNESRNTYENSRFTEKIVPGKNVLLVTSAWHMPRACGNFAKTSLVVVPAPCDFCVHNAYYGVRHFWEWIAPGADNMARTFYLAKEWLGKLARK